MSHTDFRGVAMLADDGTGSLHSQLISRPKVVVDVFRQLHSARDPARWKVAEDISAFIIGHNDDIPGSSHVSPTAAEWDSCTEAGLLDLCFSILTESNVYQDPRIVTVDEEDGIYIDRVLQCLFTGMLLFSKFNMHNCSAARRITHRVPQLLCSYWRKRDWLLNYAPNGESPPVDLTYCIHLVTQFFGLYQLQHNEVPPYEHHVAHLLIYCWIRSESHMLSAAALVLLSQASCEPNFVTDTMTGQEEFRLFLDKVRRDLVDQFFVNDDLYNILVIYKCIYSGREQAAEVYPDRSLLECFGTACRRQMCMGVRDESMTLKVLQAGLDNMHFILQFLQTSDITPWYDLLDPADNLDIMQVMAHVIVPAAAQDDTDTLTITTNLMICFKNMMKLPGAREKVRVAVQRVWKSIFKGLQDLPRSPTKHRTLSEWRIFCAAVGLKEGSRYDFELDTEPITSNEKRCYWRKCICSRRDPEHSIRVCKGCWRVFYCSSHCQRSDWQNGHRERCQRLRIP
ncbi:unnamed protein product [Somion occarium]|uniref:MYND-type domain-containing protein n=1 Tax=Somion occarium TaxID=3059160 RepID=A0ABP1CEJ6_9APHY